MSANCHNMHQTRLQQSYVANHPIVNTTIWIGFSSNAFLNQHVISVHIMLRNGKQFPRQASGKAKDSRCPTHRRDSGTLSENALESHDLCFSCMHTAGVMRTGFRGSGVFGCMWRRENYLEPETLGNPKSLSLTQQWARAH